MRNDIFDAVLSKFAECCFIYQVHPNEVIELLTSTLCTPTVTFVHGWQRLVHVTMSSMIDIILRY